MRNGREALTGQSFWAPSQLNAANAFLYTDSMSSIGRILKSYLFWTYDRGSFHYDVMVTLILLFIFLSPRFIDFKDQPAVPVAHLNQLTVTPDGTNGLIFQADAVSVDAQDSGMVRANFQRVIRPVAGSVTIDKVEPVRDATGHIVAYRAWVRK